MVELLGPVWNFSPMLRKALTHAAVTFCHLSQDAIRFFFILLKSRSALASENLFLRKQLALYHERNVPPKRVTDATRLSLVLLGKLFEWKGALRVVRMQTFVGWHRRGFKLFWRWKSQRIGRPTIAKNLRGLILTMARENPTWGQARIANELFVKLGIQVSPRTIQKYLFKDPNDRRRHPDPSQRWMTFVRNHAQSMLACDFFASVWAAKLYHSQPFMAVLSRYIEIHRQLLNMPPGPKRTQLITEASSLKR
jgi:putative transposase